MSVKVLEHCIEYSKKRQQWKNSAFLVGSYWPPCKAHPNGAFERHSGHNTLEAALKGVQAAHDLYAKTYLLTAKEIGIVGEIVLLQRNQAAPSGYNTESCWTPKPSQTTPQVQPKAASQSGLRFELIFNGRRNNLDRIDYSVGDGIIITISHGKARRRDNFTGKSVWKYILTVTAKWDKFPKSEFWLVTDNGETYLSGSFGGAEDPKDLIPSIEDKMVKALKEVRNQEGYKSALYAKSRNS